MKLIHNVSPRPSKSRTNIALLAATLLLVSCSGQTTLTTGPSGASTLAAPTGTARLPGGSALPIGSLPMASTGAPTVEPTGTPAPGDTSSPSDTAAPEGSGSTTGGDIPDNAVFLTYSDAIHAFSIDFVEGWQVSTTADGVEVRDKDSSERVKIVPPVTDVAAYVSSTDLPALQASPPFRLEKQDTVKVHGKDIIHLVYHVPSPPDPVTGKQVPSTIDRYYMPGTKALAIVSLSTPNGVDNVDAFRQMIESFKWL